MERVGSTRVELGECLSLGGRRRVGSTSPVGRGSVRGLRGRVGSSRSRDTGTSIITTLLKSIMRRREWRRCRSSRKVIAQRKRGGATAEERLGSRVVEYPAWNVHKRLLGGLGLRLIVKSVVGSPLILRLAAHRFPFWPCALIVIAMRAYPYVVRQSIASRESGGATPGDEKTSSKE